MSAPPPPPPPPPPLTGAPATPSAQKFKKTPSAGPSGDRQALLADIRNAGGGGLRLRPTKTNDRSAPIIGSAGHVSDDRSNVNHPSASSVKANAEAPADFTSELCRAISAQQNRTLKKSNGKVVVGRSSDTAGSHPHGAKQPSSIGGANAFRAERQLPDSVEQKTTDRSRPAVVGPKPTLVQNKFPVRPAATPPTMREFSPMKNEVSGVSVKALREKLLNPGTMSTLSSPTMPSPAVGVHRKYSDSQRNGSRSRYNVSAPILAEGQPPPEILVFGRGAPPPLPAKPPSRKPSIEHRRNVADKFRTLKPQSQHQQPYIDNRSRIRSSSSENLNSPQPGPYSLDNGHLVRRRNGTDMAHDVHSQRSVGAHSIHPPRPEVAPPPPPGGELPQRLFGSRTSVSVPPPPPRADSLITDLERKFVFQDIRRLPTPPEFKHLRSVKRPAPKTPVSDQVY